MAQKPSIPKGTRDFNPEQVTKRNYIFNTIQSQFEKFGFQPIETPSFENSETLMGKYGDEGDRLIFKILNSGDFLSKFNQSIIQVIKDSLYNLLGYLNVEGLDWKIYKSKFLEFIPDHIRTKKIIQLAEEKVDYVKLAEDLWNLIELELLETEEKLNKFLEGGEGRLSDFTIRIFGSFYFNFGTSYLGSYISEKALRYDLTVPFARYVVQNQNDIEFPFKRYQMQPVWRADRPQKGRFREFYQCDADVVGSTSLWQEVELVQLYDAVFSALGLKGTTIKINNRKILSGIAEVIGASDKLIDFTVALDKLDKIGEEKVKQEMLEKGISQSGIDKLQPLFTLSGDFGSQITQLKAILSTSEDGKKGIEELEFIDKAITEIGLETAQLKLDVTLARGLNYYTGAIFEVSAPDGVNMGSIGGGGRYDDLTGIFGMPNMSGVGISFGLDRIYLVLEELNLFPKTVAKSLNVLFINFGDKEALYSLKAIKSLRKNNINAELYPDSAKMKKQMQHANKRQIPFVVLVGEKEMQDQQYTLKNMISGDQEAVSLNELITKLT
ncbi:histidine--tRNA ligase [Hanstruepera neustonica]|uniref:Histidine--tRNA ligase n=1 Tax=Hanstruepera neustonica TaxID=1445657 RepID=A0A2K1DWF7_9FLAO|nr:histidine--tRNA ligase [Hanstruepera neustonica]PNQ72386.1 histidine--tRNA ligase [Hanstruepera neustonica]